MKICTPFCYEYAIKELHTSETTKMESMMTNCVLSKHSILIVKEREQDMLSCN
jgi:hypothetical protein